MAMRRALERKAVRVGMLLLGAAVLLGADCPHCDPPHVLEAAATHDAPPCHEAPAEPGPADARPESALDCDCPSCEVEAGLASLASGAEASPAVGLVSLQAPTPLTALAVRGGVWTPPPYPGFAEQAVVRLN